MPNLPGERAGDDDMLHGLDVLVAESTFVVVGETVARQSIGSPTAVKVGQPGEHLDAQGGPALPGEAPEWSGRGPM